MSLMLIADDNPQLLNILSSAARREGFDTVTALDGRQALEAFRARTPQIVLLDVMMPELDGFQVCREIRRESNIPIIMVTARGGDFEKIMEEKQSQMAEATAEPEGEAANDEAAQESAAE